MLSSPFPCQKDNFLIVIRRFRPAARAKTEFLPNTPLGIAMKTFNHQLLTAVGAKLKISPN